MAIRSFVIVLFLIAFSQQAEAGIISGIETVAEFFENVIGSVVGYIVRAATSIFRNIFYPPENRNSSIQYLLYTHENPNKACHLEPNLGSLRRCPFNASYPMEFLIHGFRATLNNESLFWPMKDQLLELHDFNVIIMNWTNYNQIPYLLASKNTISIGNELAKFIHFLVNNTGLEAKDIHLIGHSLGAHLAGNAGRRIPNLKRITGLDPAGPSYSTVEIFPALTYKDANFVDVIHTSNIKTGFGVDDPIGDIDFYPNGGTEQPQCETLGVNFTGRDSLFTGSCNHRASIEYFLESINTTKCTFLSTLCGSYTDFLKGSCSNDSSPMAEMGLSAQPILGLDPKSKFYLRTHVYKPYCDQNGYEPKVDT